MSTATKAVAGQAIHSLEKLGYVSRMASSATSGVWISDQFPYKPLNVPK
ncbi:MAG TPA: hypothetical protein VIP51_06380 [Eoetvoesiella sp.]